MDLRQRSELKQLDYGNFIANYALQHTTTCTTTTNNNNSHKNEIRGVFKR